MMKTMPPNHIKGDSYSLTTVQETFAIEYLYKEYFYYCTSWITAGGGNMEDAKEVFQEALLVLFINLRKKDFTLKYSLRGYLYSTVRNLWFKSRKNKDNTLLIVDDPLTHFDLEDGSSDAQTKIEQEELHARYKNYLDYLDHKGKELFYLKLEAGLSDKEIAHRMNYSVEYVRQKRKRCIQYLRNKINDVQRA